MIKRKNLGVLLYLSFAFIGLLPQSILAAPPTVEEQIELLSKAIKMQPSTPPTEVSFPPEFQDIFARHCDAVKGALQMRHRKDLEKDLQKIEALHRYGQRILKEPSPMVPYLYIHWVFAKLLNQIHYSGLGDWSEDPALFEQYLPFLQENDERGMREVLKAYSEAISKPIWGAEVDLFTISLGFSGRWYRFPILPVVSETGTFTYAQRNRAYQEGIGFCGISLNSSCPLWRKDIEHLSPCFYMRGQPPMCEEHKKALYLHKVIKTLMDVNDCEQDPAIKQKNSLMLYILWYTLPHGFGHIPPWMQPSESGQDSPITSQDIQAFLRNSRYSTGLLGTRKECAIFWLQFRKLIKEVHDIKQITFGEDEDTVIYQLTQDVDQEDPHVAAITPQDLGDNFFFLYDRASDEMASESKYLIRRVTPLLKMEFKELEGHEVVVLHSPSERDKKAFEGKFIKLAESEDDEEDEEDIWVSSPARIQSTFKNGILLLERTFERFLQKESEKNGKKEAK